VDTLVQGLLAGRLNRRQSVAEHGGEDVDELAVAVGSTGELAAHALEPGGQHPVLERCAVAQRSGLAGEHRHVVPGVADRSVTPE
jgi:hypothetical protein